mmetsp:Transcript_76786/g.178107  ORF Transcript_76786/g.178107 Transcript_76786/m.178107 type:complete len:310 (-) Transcript_76786:138-1067(-)|eukprot:CAMPEP_0171075708 /NCGR_PEP_ID=MMETSP0766_2-20121228/12948_1 /TAXON_ID=439317 /ORGANISM="Gambierdiscus australes, Strain CAWD 149" /LENGTH=309 /DNA_ID=CAMNT_0011532605 /DNA_START=55 /DNA_END=984 /DNA_ORIENTATION=-
MFDFEDIPAEGSSDPIEGGNPEAQEAAAGLSSSDAQVRTHACQRLVELGLAAVEPVLGALEALASSEEDYDVKRAARKALKDIKAGVGIKPRAAAAASALPVAAAPEEAAEGSDVAATSACAGALECRVLQGCLIKKLGADPAAARITKLSRKVGSTVKTTGKTWTGPSGGEWVELDPAAEKLGWLLVEGPGFNQPGPLLERVEPGEQEPMVLKVISPVDNSQFEICLKPTQTIKQAKYWISLHIPGLVAKKIVATRDKEGRQDVSFMLEDSMKMSDTPFKNGGEFYFIYNGEMEEDIEKYKAKLAGPG